MNIFLGLVAIFCSGFGSLLLEVIWGRLGIFIFGSTTTATTIIFSLFMAGLALGNRLCNHFLFLRRRSFFSYAMFEILASCFAALLCWHYAGETHSLKSSFYVFCILTATTMMGFSIPLVVEGMKAFQSSSAWISKVYGINTLGAAAGALTAAYFWIPRFGLKNSMWVGILFLVTAAFLALILHARIRSLPTSAPALTSFSPVKRTLLWLAMYSGFVGLALELVWTRMLSLILGPSVYALGTMLFVFLAGIGIGAYAEKQIFKLSRTWTTLIQLFVVSSFVLGFSCLIFSFLPYFFVLLIQYLKPRPDQIRWIEVILTMITLFPISFFQGMLIPLLTEMGCEERRESSASAQILVWNTLGSIAGTLLTGLVLIPWVGFLPILIFLIFSALLVSGILLFTKARRDEMAKRTVGLIGFSSVMLAVALVQVWDRGILSCGVYKYAVGDALAGGEGKIGVGEVLYFKEGLASTVAVVKTANDIVLSIDGKADATFYGDRSTQVLLGALPLSLSKSTEKTLVIGYASGVTSGVASLFENSHVISAEIEPKVYEAAQKYFQPINYGPLLPPRHQMEVTDGRHFLKKYRGTFDVITSEPSNPWMSGVAPLFTSEFFELAKSKLNSGGIMCQWLPIYGMSFEVISSIMKTFSDVFPHMLIFASVEGNDLLLIGSQTPIQLNPKEIEKRWKNSKIKNELHAIQIDRGVDLIGRFLIGSTGVIEMTKNSSVNTDDNGYVEYRAPWYLHLRTAEMNDQRILEYSDSILPYLAPEARSKNVLQDLRKHFQKRGKFILAEKLL